MITEHYYANGLAVWPDESSWRPQDCCGIFLENLYIVICRRRWRILPLLTLVEASWHNFWSVTLNQVFSKLEKHTHTKPSNPVSLTVWYLTIGCISSWVYVGGAVVADLLLLTPWLLCWSVLSQQWWGSQSWGPTRWRLLTSCHDTMNLRRAKGSSPWTERQRVA